MDTKDKEREREDELMQDAATTGGNSDHSSQSDVVEKYPADNEVEKLKNLRLNSDDAKVPQEEAHASQSPMIDVGGSAPKPVSETNARTKPVDRSRLRAARTSSKGNHVSRKEHATLSQFEDIASFDSKRLGGAPNPRHLSQKVPPPASAARTRVGQKRPPLQPKAIDVVGNAESQAPSFVNRKSRRKVSETADAIYQAPKRRRQGGQPSQNQRSQVGRRA